MCVLSYEDFLEPHGQRMGFPRQEYWSGLPFPPPGALPIPASLRCFALAGRWFTTSAPWGFEEIGLIFQ